MSDRLVRDLEQLTALPSTQRCQITLVNKCPPGWEVVIAAAGVKFFYRNAGDYTDGPRSVNLATGASATFFSDDDAKCVRQCFAAFSVVVPGERPETLTDRFSVPDGECLLHETVTLAPKPGLEHMNPRGPLMRHLVVRRSL